MPLNKPDFEKGFSLMVDGVKDVIKQNVRRHRDIAIAESINILQAAKDDFIRLSAAASAGTITKDEVELLVKSKIDLAEMTALREAGLTKARIDKVKRDIFNVAIKVIFTMIATV